MFTLTNVELFRSLFVFGIRVGGRGRFCRSSTFFFHWPAELLAAQKTLRYVSVRHHRSGVQKRQDDTRQSSNGPRTRTPPTPVITAWKANLFLLLSLPVCSAVRWRVLCLKTIGAGTRIRLGFPNVRPVVSDEFARSSAGQWRKALPDRSRRTGLTV